MEALRADPKGSRLLADFHELRQDFSLTYESSVNTLGFCSAIRNKAAAGPLGLRRPCSQSWTVRRLIPISPAKADCDSFNFARITCGGAGSFNVRVRSFFFPAL